MPSGQPPITKGSGLFSSDWLPGPEDGSDRPVVVSFTDFRANGEGELAEIFKAGLELGKSWPIMSGALGMWLWAKPEALRGGSLSVWRSGEDLRRFVRWPVHAAVIEAWRPRIEVLTQLWEDHGFVAESVWLRAERHMRLRREAHAGQGRGLSVTAARVAAGAARVPPPA